MIQTFITNNNLSFEEGNRNTTLTILIGYALYLKLNQEDLEVALENEIENDSWLQDEINRLWDYCSDRNYGNYWKTKDAKDKYKF